MSDLYTIDFETYYSKSYSLGKMTTQEYIMGDEFEIIGVSVAKNSEPAEWYSYPTIAQYKHLLSELNGKMVLAHNTMFDAGILSFVLGVHPKVLLDTLSMSKPLHGLTVGGSLKALAQKYGVGVKGTEIVNALGKHREDFTADELAAYGEYCKNDVDLCRELFKKMMPRTPKLEMEVIDTTIKMFTEPKLELDASALKGALAKEIIFKETLLERLSIDRKEVMSNPKFAELLTARGVDIPLKISPTTGKSALPFAKTDPFMQELRSHEDEEVRLLAEARIANKSTLNQSRMETFIRLSEYGAFPVPLMYCGAVTTWRWSGMDSLNMQNLPRGGELRNAIVAPDGYVLVVSDSSNIELRTNHTLAGQQDTIIALREGKDLYVEFAALLYDKEPEEVTKDERFVGKVAHLSLGYGCGWRKFQDMCRIYGAEVSDAEAENIVRTWRSRYARIPAMWKNADVLIASMLGHDSYSLPTAPFVRSRKGVLLTPPQHHIQYPKLQNGHDGFTYQSRRGRGTEKVKLYGGKLIENLCQHISRNIIAEQLVKISKRYPVAMTVHDEFCCVVPEDEADEALPWMLDIMSQSPVWWPEIPLAAEGDIARAYGDAK